MYVLLCNLYVLFSICSCMHFLHSLNNALPEICVLLSGASERGVYLQTDHFVRECVCACAR